MWPSASATGEDVLRGRRVGLAGAVAVVLVAVAVAVPAAVPAGAAEDARPPGGRGLPLSSFGQLLVDPARERVYVSGGSAGDAIVVADYSGGIVATLTGHPGASGMVLHQGILFVALPSVPAIGLLDAETLRPVSRVLLPPDAHPWDLAEAGGRLWFQRSGPGFASMDLASYRVDLFDQPAVVAPRFATSPGDPGLLLVADGGAAPPRVHRLDLAVSPFAVAASRTFVGSGSVNDLRVDPRGTTFWLAAGAPYEVGEFRVDTLEDTGSAYVTGAYPAAVDYGAGGRGRIAAGLSWNAGRAVQVFRRGAAAAVRTFAIEGHVQPMGVRFAPDGRFLFVVTAAVPDGPPVLHVLRTADRAA